MSTAVRAMQAERYIWQVMLNTGATSESRREDVSDEALAAVRFWLDQEGSFDAAELGTRVTVTRVGRALLLQVGARMAVGVAPRGRESPALWRALHETPLTSDLVTDPDRPPQTPWCGLVLSDRMREMPRDVTLAHVLLARVAGWAWIERRG